MNFNAHGDTWWAAAMSSDVRSGISMAVTVRFSVHEGEEDFVEVDELAWTKV
jgi:hypothetical protein